MPDWKIHLLFGCLLAVFWFNIFYFGGFVQDTVKTVLLLLTSLFSTVFADIDEKHSKIRGILSLGLAFAISLIYIAFFPGTWYYALFYFVILLAIFRFVPTKHRGITHSIKFSVVFSAALAAFFFFVLNLSYPDAALWFVTIFLSYGVHMLLDSL